ncbi:MAG: hypothetical protein COB15_02180 [Flavobacteriales bacterium]|nr:MAG: hypothetical protein COB15_02180 [Flavobacteriales bacterium]
MNKLLYITTALILTTLYSCETDIDINAPYEDITIVYGIINPGETNHYIKINKAFLGDVSALDLAANSDNFNYGANELDVTVEEFNGNGNVVNTYSTGAGTVIRTTDSIPKDPGVFDNSSNVLYKFVEPSININNTYKLKIINAGLDKEVTSETRIIGTTYVAFPTSTGANFKFWDGHPSTGKEIDNTKIGVTTGPNIGRAGATLVFKYIEHYTTASMKPSVEKTILMPLGEVRGTTSLGNESLEWSITGGTFFANIFANVSDPNSVTDFSHRELDNISVDFLLSGTELSTYMAVSAPSNTVNQDKPVYSNINNGIGIFSSRDNLSYTSSKVTANGHVNIHPETIKYLKSRNLGFCFGISDPTYKCTQL